MQPYDPDACCPKCGHEKVRTIYQAALGRYAYRSADVLTEKEHLRRRCERCGFAWAEAIVALTPASSARPDKANMREVRESRLRDMGFAVPMTYVNEAQVVRQSDEALQLYRLRYPSDPVTQGDMCDAMSLPRPIGPVA